jgi:flagellar hook-associated protein 3
MQISTNLMFDRATNRMMDVQQRLATAQAQMATGKGIISPSDAPQKASAIQRLRDQITRQESHLTTLSMASQRFGTEEVALTSASDVLIRMKELTLSAANATKNPQAHDAIAVEMENLRDELLSLANTRDNSGNYIFSGTRVTTQAYARQADGSVVFQGDQTQTRVPAGIERQVLYTRSGSDVFQRVVRDNDGPGDLVLSAPDGTTGLRTLTGTAEAGSTVTVTAPDGVTTFTATADSAGDFEVTVEADATGTYNITSTNALGDYTSSASQVEVSDATAAGVVLASEQRAVGFFEAIDDMVNAVKANNVDRIQRSVTEVDSMIDGVALSLAAVGSDTAVIDSQTNVLETEILRLRTSLSGIEDLDYTEAVTQMTKDTLALQAAQASFAKISQLSLFDYIGR